MRGEGASVGMTLERFQALAQAWGGDIARWPEAERAAAALLAARAPQAAAALAEAAALDAALAEMDAGPGPAPSSALLAACAEAAVREAAVREAGRRADARRAARRGVRLPMAARMAAAAVAGVLIGVSGLMEALEPPQDADAALVTSDLLAPPDDLAALFEEPT